MTATIDLDNAITVETSATAARMGEAALAFLECLNHGQRQAATLPFGDDRRYVWDYRPMETTPRNGLRLISMTSDQQRKALALLDIGLSAAGAEQVRQIMRLETALRLQEQLEGRVTMFVRDPEQYAVCIFGDPAGRGPWGWHIGGHHVGVHFTVIDGTRVVSVPLFFGANPAEVRHGPTTGQRTLPEIEDWARALLRSLPADQKQIAVVSSTAYPDILTDSFRVANAFAPPRGLAFHQMQGEHRDQLVRLIRHYIERTNAELSGAAWDKVTLAGLQSITFAWAKAVEPGQGHYYTIKGPTFLIEYDNTQNEANHIHSVLRDIAGDWGDDLIAAHYAESHRNGH